VGKLVNSNVLPRVKNPVCGFWLGTDSHPFHVYWPITLNPDNGFLSKTNTASTCCAPHTEVLSELPMNGNIWDVWQCNLDWPLAASTESVANAEK
jgi:hypothetical protein